MNIWTKCHGNLSNCCRHVLLNIMKVNLMMKLQRENWMTIHRQTFWDISILTKLMEWSIKVQNYGNYLSYLDAVENMLISCICLYFIVDREAGQETRDVESRTTWDNCPHLELKARTLAAQITEPEGHPIMQCNWFRNISLTLAYWLTVSGSRSDSLTDWLAG